MNPTSSLQKMPVSRISLGRLFRRFGKLPDVRKLVRDCYCDEDLLDAAERFSKSEEPSGVLGCISPETRWTPGSAVDLGGGNGVASLAYQWAGYDLVLAEPVGTLAAEQIPVFVNKIEAQACFLLIEHKERFDKHGYLDPERVYYLRTHGSPVSDWPMGGWGVDLSRTMPGCQTTAHMAILIALYLGCSPIYLIGLDHDWLAQPLLATHFYASSAQDDFSMLCYRQLMETALRVWTTHEWIKDVASNQGTAIYNATDGGFLDVYERADYGSITESRPTASGSRRAQGRSR